MNGQDIKEIQEKVSRYETAIESLEELMQKDNEIEPVKHLQLYLKEQKAHVLRVNNSKIFDIPVNDARFVKH
jgi:hypothetical protein